MSPKNKAAILGCLAAASAFGQELKLTVGNGSVTVLVFLSTVCPVSASYSPRLNDLYRDYADKGVKFVFANSNQNEPAGAAGYPFPVYKDVGNVLADRFGARYTPESFVIDGAGKVRYHGRIDDAQNPARVTRNSLRLAIDAVLAGREVAQPETKAFGCTIKRVRKAS